MEHGVCFGVDFFFFDFSLLFLYHFACGVCVQIVSGLKYVNKFYKAGIRVANEETMLGSYAPRPEPYSVTVPRNAWVIFFNFFLANEATMLGSCAPRPEPRRVTVPRNASLCVCVCVCVCACVRLCVFVCV